MLGLGLGLVSVVLIFNSVAVVLICFAFFCISGSIALLGIVLALMYLFSFLNIHIFVSEPAICYTSSRETGRGKAYACCTRC